MQHSNKNPITLLWTIKKNDCVQEPTVYNLTFIAFILILHFFWHDNIKPERKRTLLPKNLLQVGAFGKVLQSISGFGLTFFNSQIL